MKRYLLDTGIAADHIDRRNHVFEHARAMSKAGATLGLGAPVLGELWTGVCHSQSPERNMKLLERQGSRI